MHGTTFPGDPGSGGYNSSFQSEKKPWQGGGGGNGGGFNKKFGPPKPEEIDPTLYLSAAVTGNKDTPPAILNKTTELVRYLESCGFVIRFGSDGPMEEAAEAAAIAKKEHILPWKDFNNKTSSMTWSIERAHHIAKMFHPTYDMLKKGVHGILAKNARLVMGHKMMSPATLLLVWTEDGAEAYREVTSQSGFAGHPIKIANAAGVRVFNLARPDAEQRLREYVDNLIRNKG